MELQIPEINLILQEIKELKTTKEKLELNERLKQEFYNENQCWELKGGCSLNTYKQIRFYQCKGGIPDGHVGGRKVWSRESVMEWLPLTDEQLEAYHTKYKTGAKRGER